MSAKKKSNPTSKPEKKNKDTKEIKPKKKAK
jgi:hypothetical protein